MTNYLSKIKTVLLIAVMILSMHVNGQTHLKVFLLAGQSNAAGYGLNIDIPMESQAMQHVKIYVSADCDFSIADKWSYVSPGMGATINHHGCELSVATKLSALLPTDSIAVIKFSLGATLLETQWRSPSAGGPTDPDPEKHLFQRFVNTVHTALESLAPDYSYEIAGMLWMQGESDGKTIGNANNYGYNLSRFITDIRQALDVPNMPFIIGKISTAERWVYAEIIRDAQDSVAKLTPYVGIIDANKYPLGPDGMHYTSEGLLSMGNDFSLSLDSILSTIVSADIGSILNDEKGDEIHIYPNPSYDGKLNIQLKKYHNVKLEFFNVTGKLVMESFLYKAVYEVDISKFERGIYFVRCMSDKNIVTKKLIIR